MKKLIAVAVTVLLLLPILFTGAAKADLAVPTEFEAYGFGDVIRLEWSYPKTDLGAGEVLNFEVFEYNFTNLSWKYLGSTQNTKTEIKGASYGRHVYKVRAKFVSNGSVSYSKFSETDYAFKLHKPDGTVSPELNGFTPPYAKGSWDVMVKWDAKPGPFASDLVVLRKKFGKNLFKSIGTVDKTEKSFTDKSVEPNTKYVYAIMAVRKQSGKKSDVSFLLQQNGSVLTYPEAPKDFKASGDGSDIVLTWDAQEDCDGLNVYKKKDAMKWFLVKKLGNHVVKFTIKNADPGKYTFLIAAYNASRNSPDAPVRTAYVLKKPTGVVAKTYATDEIQIKYDAVDPNATEIKVYWSYEDKDFKLMGSVKSDLTFIRVRKLKPGTKYYFKLSFARGGNESPLSEMVSAKTFTPRTPPAAPSNLTVQLLENGNVLLQWTDNANDEADFSVERKTAGGSYEKIATLAGEIKDTKYIDKTVLPGTTYYYRVKAFNRSGVSPYSNEVSITTKANAIQKTEIKLNPDNPMMTVNGVKKEIDPGRGTKPVIIPKWGRTVVPIRAIVEALGGTIEWDGVARKVMIKFNGNKIELRIDNPRARVNGKAKWIDENNHNVRPIIRNDRTMLPLRFVAESLGCKVDWDNDTRTITITYPKP